MIDHRRFTLDTNLLVHAINTDAGEKHKVAAELLASAPRRHCVLTLQAMSEFVNVVGRRNMLSIDKAIDAARLWQKYFTIVPPILDGCNEAMEFVRDHKMPYWDAMLWATAKQAGCAYVLSEGMQHGHRLGGVEIVNPFVKDAKPIIEGLYKKA